MKHQHTLYQEAIYGLPGEMACATLMNGNSQPKSMSRARMWTDEVENLYRFQQAGYRDELEYRQIKQVEIERWPMSGYVKKLQRRDNTFYYYSKRRECDDKEVNKVKMYVY
ncbi:meiosis expressed gene 1 protein homolog isoform X2 [Silurus meridionalis]|uniref:meiosis expressed gene 1 protein homolog isoform X2 n=1 Tax=Silurus meridionalis TaxID=175797 RepID=UPI001EE9F679|nr:meiosis expressed gene 1 protein homolog isoform X2 [Silurus meridionalis]